MTTIEKTRKENKQHLVQLDIDGTITGFDGVDDFSTLNPKVKKVIKKITEDGHIVCLSTGRNLISAMLMYRQAELNSYLTAYNGAYILNPNDPYSAPTVLFVSNKMITEILNEPLIKNSILSALIDCSDLTTICTNGDEAHYRKIFFHNNENYPYTPSSLEELTKKLDKKDVIQLVIEFNNDPALINNIFSVLRKYKDAISFYLENKFFLSKSKDKVLIVDPTKICFRIRNKNASKARGVETVASLYNIPLDRALAFGNGVNDVEVIKAVGKGIVTSDSDVFLKSIAYDIISYQFKLNSDGVADYLAKYFGYKIE